MLNDIAKNAHENAVEKGFYDKEIGMGTALMLVVSELSEALEADRNGRHCKPVIVGFINNIKDEDLFLENFSNIIKDTLEDEIADAMIRLLDICAHHKIDIDAHVKMKMRYNKSREYMHGKLY